jgi:phytoene dehydrogenase-like protein
MTEASRRVVVIGGGIAGLCAAVYARRCGYEVEVFEQHDVAGGLATSWRRGDYTFETCLHWLLGSNPGRSVHAQWRQVFDIDSLTFVYPEVFARLETEHGECLNVYADIDRMEAEFLRQAPRDSAEVRRFAAAVRRLARFEIPDPAEAWPRNWLTLSRTLPYLPVLRHWSSITCEEAGKRFTHKLLSCFFTDGGQLSALALVLCLSWMSQHDAGYPIGGSQAVIRLIVDNLRRLGAQLRLGARVEKIVVQRNEAVGVQLAGGETVAADWVISAADGHATTYDLLGGKYTDAATDKIYSTLQTFPSYLQVSLGVARDLSRQAGYMTRLLDAALEVDPDTRLEHVSFRFFHFDPTFAPPGKTAVTCFLPTRNFEFWSRLRRDDPARYQAEKQRVADAVIAILEKSTPDLRQAIEVIDVSTPASVIRYTGNWKGSMEGWLLTPSTRFRPLRQILPGLGRFLMVGQWVMPGGGLPSGLITARSAVRAICRTDHVRFAV